MWTVGPPRQGARGNLHRGDLEEAALRTPEGRPDDRVVALGLALVGRAKLLRRNPAVLAPEERPQPSNPGYL